MCNAQARHLNLLLPQGNSSSAFFLYYQATKSARSRFNTLTKNWNGLVELFHGDLGFFFQNFETITQCQIHNKPWPWRQVNRQISLHITWFFKQKLTPPLYQHYPNPFLIKERRKSENLSLKSFFRTSEQPFAIDFLVVSCNVFPVAIPEICA